MSHWGIGPKFSLMTLLYCVPVGFFVHRNPSALRITFLPRPWLAMLGILLVIGGTAIYIRSLAVLRAGRRRGELVTSGPYAVVRHPIYAVWILLIGPGIALCVGSWLALTVPVVAYGAFKACVREEDDHLQATFGDAYSDYRNRTPELLPLPR